MATVISFDDSNEVDLSSAEVGARKIDTGRGSSNGIVSHQWATRRNDEKFLSMEALAAHVRANAAARETEIFDVEEVKLIASEKDLHSLQVEINERVLSPTHWVFGQACTQAKAPASYLRNLPAALAAINLQYGVATHRERMMAYIDRRGDQLVAITGPEYGRIQDVEVVEAIMRIVGEQPQWKVPGTLDWGTMVYNPYVDVTKDTTTLFAGDRDVNVFLCDDTHPIEIGKLANGEPDYVFRGFHAWNSEVGFTSAGVETYLLRGMCCNRNMWGIEDFSELRINHTKNAPLRWERDALPKLRDYSNASDRLIIEGVKKAKDAVVATNDDERREFLAKTAGLSKALSIKVIDTVEREEGHPARSIWDMVQGITAVARTLDNQDARLDLENVGGKLLKKATK